MKCNNGINWSGVSNVILSAYAGAISLWAIMTTIVCARLDTENEFLKKENEELKRRLMEPIFIKDVEGE